MCGYSCPSSCWFVDGYACWTACMSGCGIVGCVGMVGIVGVVCDVGIVVDDVGRV